MTFFIEWITFLNGVAWQAVVLFELEFCSYGHVNDYNVVGFEIMFQSCATVFYGVGCTMTVK